MTAPALRQEPHDTPDELLRAALDASDTLLCEFNAENVVARVAGPFERVLGVDPETLPGQHINHITGIGAESRTAYERARAGQATTVQHWLFDRAFVHTRYTPVRDAAGTVIGVRTFCTDRTSLALSSDAARASDDQLLAITDSLPDGLILLDSQLRTVWANASVRAFTGRTGEEIAGTTVEQHFPSEDAAQAAAYLSARLGGVHTADRPHVHLRTQDRTGGWHEIRLSATRCDLAGGEYGLLVHLQDVTTERALARAVEARASETVRILDAAPMPIVIIDAQGTILQAGGTIASTFGWTADALIGENVELLADLLPSQHVEWMQHYAATGESSTPDGLVIGRTRTVPARRRDGTPFPAELTVTVLPQEGGPPHYVGILQDISERKQTEERLIQAQKSEAVGTLLAGVTHDFNNLLTSIIGGITLARDTRSDPTASAQWLDLALTGAERATTLVRQLLQMSRRTPPDPTLVDIDALATETVSLVRETFDRRIEIHLEADARGLLVQGDRGQLQQVLMNLAINARDAVTERTEHAPPDYLPFVRIIVRPAADVPADASSRLQLVVQDNGTGMPAEVRTRIFDPFFTTKAGHGGTGLGLATSYSIVQGHGGSLDVQSTVGNGTVFTITLPAVRTATDGDTEHGTADPHVAPAILVVDDEDSVRSIAMEVLRNAGYAVHAASSGTEALQLISRLSPVLVLLDVNMPRPNGWETLDALREVAPDLPVIMVSGYASPDEASAHGAQGLVEKPYRSEMLLYAVQAALAGR